jgi:curved DNA-binding protein CbpA
VASHESSRRPRPVEGIDLRKLPLTPQEAFVLSRVDGMLSESDLVLLTGLDPAAVQRALARLAELGALAFEDAPAARHSVPPRRPSGAIRLGPIVEVRSEPEPHHAAAALYDPAELDEPVDLDLQRKRRILDTFYALDTLTHYQLLGVKHEADKKAVKAAYFDLVNVFHPDRYFGKTLGTFKHKLERVFARVTEAHDVLTRLEARAEYDRYLASQQRTRQLSQTLEDAQAAASELERIEREIAEQARAVERAQHLPPPRETRASDSSGRLPVARPLIAEVGSSSVPPAPSSGSRFPSQQPLDPDARRRALARKLGVSVPPPKPTPELPPQVAREAAADDLLHRYKHRVGELTKRQIERYVQAAETAIASKDLISAANALRIACSLAPTDAKLSARYEEVQTQAAATLAASYLEQAQYEEREGRFAEAARSYERVARGKPGARVFERVAFCLLTAKGDLKLAAEWAKKAVGAAPEDPSCRVTLARIYLEGGLRQSAVAEFERAATISPKDDTIKDWLRRAKRSDA